MGGNSELLTQGGQESTGRWVEDLEEKEGHQNESESTAKLDAWHTKRLEHVPPLYKKLVTRAWLGQCSPRQAIKAKCYECVAFEDTHRRVSECQSKGCPLWTFRPVKS